MPHSHQHGSCEHEATDLDVDPLELGIQYSLYEKIDFNNLVIKEFAAYWIILTS